MFWGGKRLEKELSALISDYDPDRIDRASYRLRVGPEVYVSPTGEPDDPRNKPKTQLAPGQGFTVPGVGPSGRTGSGYWIDHLPGVLLLKLDRTDIAES
jgi:hypothetical protein